jgi:hypothetical protein
MTSNAPEPDEGGSPVPAAIAATEEPIQLEVAIIEDERVPPEMVCMGTYRNGRLVARAVMTPEAWDQIEEHGFFDEPLQVVLVARVAPPGLQCQLFAMVPLPAEESEDSAEPGRPAFRDHPTKRALREKRTLRMIPEWPRCHWETSCATSETGFTPRVCRSKRPTCSRRSSRATRRRWWIERWRICWAWMGKDKRKREKQQREQ